ncbi:MAG: cobalt transporter CbiM [Gammaproteobacteria bacterium]|jgi:cobalt/nickel transport system permease protein|nr:cobalt transporter CbiM [Gammaproteobacteria bacterium]MCP4881293.1 cobalt transporter CbiM [Gammaproteobacteria bacterium]
MHIVDGALSTQVLVVGAAVSCLGLALGLRRMPLDKIPVTGMLAATFFVASLIHVPLGPSSLHLIMNGVAGLLLGWAAVPALFIGLLLQAVFFGYGGITVLGINTVNVALPAVAVFYLVRPFIIGARASQGLFWGAVGGGLAVALTTLMVAASLWVSGDEFIPTAKLVLISHIPVVIIEALLSGATVYLVCKVKPELFMGRG